jgi:outer membrane lipoprotein-sorting protein
MFRQSLLFITFILSTIAAAAQTASHAQFVDTVLNNYVSFLGGEQNLKQVQSRIDSGSYNYGGIEFPFVSWSKAPDSYKYTVTSNGKYFTQSFDGKEGWKIDVFKNQKSKTLLKGNDAKAMANEADVNIEPAFINYHQKHHTAYSAGTDTVDGRLCNCIKFIYANNSTALFCFDKETGALLEKIALAKNAELNNAILQTFYTDYREIGGIKIPFKTISKIKDQAVLTITLKSVTLNPPIDAAIFKP